MFVFQTLIEKLTRTKPVHAHHAHDHARGGLARSMGLFSLTMIGVGATIGTGIFFTMVEAVPKAGPAVMLSFLLAALTAGLTALCYAELSFRVPASGSSYSFAYATVGEFLAFIMAACLLLEYGLAASATAIGWSAYLEQFPRQCLRLADSERLAHADDRVDARWRRVPSGTSTCRRSSWWSCAASCCCAARRNPPAPMRSWC